MKSATYIRLAAMMFLQFFVWGAWFVTMGTYLTTLGWSGSQIGLAYLTNNIAAIASPFFVGMIVDRYFDAKKVLGILHLLGAVILLLLTSLTSTSALMLGLLVYNLSYMPTLALVNAVSFNQMSSPDKQFPSVRVFGTIGWIAAALFITFILGANFADVERTSWPLKLAAISAVAMGIYSFTLPATPTRAGKESDIGSILGLKALHVLKERNFFIFVLSSLLISIPLAFYYNFTNVFLNDLATSGAATIQSMGQMSEVVFMLMMPWFFVRLGVKKMLLVGMLAWVVRYALFALGDNGSGAWMLYSGILLHGVCYDFFFVTGQIYVDQKTAKEVRASAQGFITLITYGLGIGIGSILSGLVVDYFTVNSVRDWSTIWLVPSVFAMCVALFFWAVFRSTEEHHP